MEGEKLEKWLSNACEVCKTSEKNIDDCYDLVIKGLTTLGKIKEVSMGLLACKNNYDRVVFVYHVLKDLGLFPVIRKNPKENVIAVHYRCEGNDYFKQQKNYEALQCYNLSLLYAQPESEHLVLAVSNRSAVLYDMGKYHECLEDIKFVFNTHYPEKIRTKLMERKQKCLDKLKATESQSKIDTNGEEIAEIMKLKGPRDKKYVSASTKLKVAYTKEMGRHVVANEDIQVGEVLVQEDPYLTVLLKNQFLFCCAYCLSRNWNLYPCLTCTYTLYCSIECRDAAYKEYHSVECPMMPALVGMEFTKMEWLTIRTVIKSRTDSYTWQDAVKTAQVADSRVNTDIWGCVKVDNEWVYDSKYYTSIHTLATNFEKRSAADLFRKTLTSVVLFRFLAMVGFMKNNSVPKLHRAKRYVGSTLLTHLMTSPTNMHSISTITQNADGNYIEELDIACGAYAFLSLINHSCAPNVVRYTKLGTAQMSLIAIRPIKKGMQILDNYGYHHALQDRKTRQENLEFQYKFTCACQACVNDWPLHDGLREAKGLPESILRKKEQVLSPAVIGKLMKADKETAVQSFKLLCELIEVLDAYAPCKELAECQEALKQCLAIFYGVVPYMKEILWKAIGACLAKGPPHEFDCLYGPIPGFDEYME